MSLSQETLLELMAFADDELEAGERARQDVLALSGVHGGVKLGGDGEQVAVLRVNLGNSDRVAIFSIRTYFSYRPKSFKLRRPPGGTL